MDSSPIDIIIVGAGTAGLTLAKELSKDSTVRIRIVEAGKDNTGHTNLQNVLNYTANLGSERDWHFDSVPQAGFNGRTATQNSGKLLGGSSAINGGYYVAPSRAGLNAWAKLGNTAWSYEKLKQACFETIQSHGPDEHFCHNLGLDMKSNESGTGPVKIAAELEDHPITRAYFQALRDLGYPTTSAIFNDRSAFGQALYLTQDPATKVRSDANTAFGLALKQRPNVTLSLDTTVKKVILEGKPPNVRARGVEIVVGGDNGQIRTLFASQEVILSAGALNTPKILELSGIGQEKLLEKYSIPVVVGNDFVGERLRNHVMCAIHRELDRPVPATVPGLKAMAYMSSKDQPGLVEVLQNYVGRDCDDRAYDDEARSILLDPQEGSCCHFMGFLGVPNCYTFGVISAIPFSSGSTHIASSDFQDKPVVDPRFYSHPLDIEVVARHLMTAANFAEQPAMKPFFKIDGDGIGADLDKAKAKVHESSVTAYHACGTVSMRPREDGGVVDEHFKVYGTANLRVVDASIIPLIPDGNPMATVYGVAQRAAAIVKEASA